MKISLDTIILFVQDIDKLKEFYTEQLQLKLLEEYPGWILLQAGSGKIGLHLAGEPYRLENKAEGGAGGNTKLVFDVQEDIHAWRERLTSNGVAMRDIRTFEGYDYWICDGEDPEGNVFQLRQGKR